MENEYIIYKSFSLGCYLQPDNNNNKKKTQYPSGRTWYKAPHQRAELHDNKHGATFALHQNLNVPLMADDETFKSLQCCKSFFVSIPFWSSAGEESHRQLWNAKSCRWKKNNLAETQKLPQQDNEFEGVILGRNWARTHTDTNKLNQENCGVTYREIL